MIQVPSWICLLEGPMKHFWLNKKNILTNMYSAMANVDYFRYIDDMELALKNPFTA